MCDKQTAFDSGLTKLIAILDYTINAKHTDARSGGTKAENLLLFADLTGSFRYMAYGILAVDL